MKVFRHVLAVSFSLFLLLGLPLIHYGGISRLTSGADAVSGATAVLPEAPSGSYVIFVNRENHSGTLDQWRAFFSEEDYGILLEDVHCLVIEGDTGAEQLARRYQGRLVKDQMILRRENGVLAASRLDWGQYDFAIVSEEMAEIWEISAPAGAEIMTVREEVP